MPPKFPSFPSQESGQDNKIETTEEKIKGIERLLVERGITKEDLDYIPPEIKIAWEKTEDIFKNRIQPSNFSDVESLKKLIPVAEIYTKKREREFRLDREKMYASVLEAILYDEIQKKHWLGKDARPFLTSNYDDYRNGADLAVEMQGESVFAEPHPVLFAIDATYSQSIRRVQEKLKKAFQKIKQGTMGEITFYESKNKRFRGQIQYVPIVTVGVDKPVIQQMSKLWVDKTLASELDNHPAKLLIQTQSYTQLHAFHKYLTRHVEVPNRDIMLEIIQSEILMAKAVQSTTKIPERYSSDPVHVAIMQETSALAQS